MIANPDCLFLGGHWVKSRTKARFTMIDAVTETPYLDVALASIDEVEQAVAIASRTHASGQWSDLPVLQRAAFIRAIGDQLLLRIEDVAEAWVRESGVVYAQAKARLPSILKTYHYYADLAKTHAFESSHPSESGGKLALKIQEPVGVVAAIVPWNGAPALIAKKVAPALLAGCPVVLKASPEAPLNAYLVAEAAVAAGLPEGVLSVICAERDASEHLVRDRAVHKLSFTGSTAVGLRLAGICSERLARYTLELGGKSPAVVLDDFDIASAAKTIAAASSFLSGQQCSALTRVIVSAARHDQMVEALAAAYSDNIIGDPFDPNVTMGPVALQRQFDRVMGFIDQGRQSGATLACGGGRPVGLNRGFYVEPTVFGGVDNASTIAQQEIFGPVLSVIPAANEAEALELANANSYGLNASVFTQDPQRAYRAARRLRAGSIGQNGFRNEHNIAVGGFGLSGIGREGGVEGLLAYTETKVVVLEGGHTA